MAQVWSREVEPHGADTARIHHESRLGKDLESLRRGGKGHAAARQLPPQPAQGAAHQGGDHLIAPGVGRIAQQVPEVGVEGQVAGGPQEAHQAVLVILHAQVPGAAFQHLAPALGTAGPLVAAEQQAIETLGGRFPRCCQITLGGLDQVVSLRQKLGRAGGAEGDQQGGGNGFGSQVLNGLISTFGALAPLAIKAAGMGMGVGF